MLSLNTVLKILYCLDIIYHGTLECLAGTYQDCLIFLSWVFNAPVFNIGQQCKSKSLVELEAESKFVP